MNHPSLLSNPGYAAFRPLGFGRTNTRAPAMDPRLGPGPVSRLSGSTIRASVTPTSATTRGRNASIFRSSSRTPASYSRRISSAAVRVGLAHTFVSPSPNSTTRASSTGRSSSGVNPDA